MNIAAIALPLAEQKFLDRIPLNSVLQKSVGYYRKLDIPVADYWDLIDDLREKYEKVKGHKPQSWFDAFHGHEIQRQEREEQDERVKRWKSDRNWIFRALISKWVKLRKR
jgi:hypothetical protein